jgi:C4-dicarboxylate-binding protein DctP
VLRAAAALVGAGAGVGAAQTGVLTLRFSHVVAPDTPKGLAVDHFRSLVAERSGGRIRVAVYPDARLYGDHDEMQALHLGAVEMLAPSLSKFGRIGFPEFKHMSAHRPLLTPADFVGLRMRVQSSWVIAAQMRALGARPVTLAFSETRQALAAGVVDGTENPLSNFWTQRMHEVQSDVSLTQHAYLGYAVVVNQRFWDGLAPPDRDLLAAAIHDAVAFGQRMADARHDSALAALKAEGRTRIHVPQPGQLAQLHAAVAPVHTALARRIGPEWLERARAAMA